MQKLIFFFLVLLGASSDCQEEHLDIPKTKITILFIGNSLTYTNNLPVLVKKYAKQKGIHIKTTMVAHPNYALIDHWLEGKVQTLISSKTYDFVIVQQGPSSLSSSRKMLIEDGTGYSNLCKLYNAKLCYFTVWPSLNYYYSFDDVIKNYKDAAEINDAVLLPVGNNWKDYIDTTQDYSYYGPDGFHPSKKGSEMAAKVIVENLFRL